MIKSTLSVAISLAPNTTAQQALSLWKALEGVSLQIVFSDTSIGKGFHIAIPGQAIPLGPCTSLIIGGPLQGVRDGHLADLSTLDIPLSVQLVSQEFIEELKKQIREADPREHRG